MTTFEAMRILVPASVAFLIGIGLTPFVTHFLYKHRMWKFKAGKMALDGTPAVMRNQLHATRDTGVPHFGGIVVWGSVLLTAGLLSTLGKTFPDAFSTLSFISRNQTWVPLAVLALGSLIGFLDDFYTVRGRDGLRLRMRLVMVAAIAVMVAWWFYDKLDVMSISTPFLHTPVFLGAWFIPLFVLVTLFIYAGGVIDGIDGLAGGIFATMFGAYAGIALFQNQMDIAAFSAAVCGGLLAFLWFNIPPARFYLSETGTMGLTITLVVIAFLTDTLGGGKGLTVLPIIALPLVATVFSNLLQMFWKKVFKRKLFRIAPLHHHFEALGWPPYKVTMRYWIVGVAAAIIGMMVALL